MLKHSSQRGKKKNLKITLFFFFWVFWSDKGIWRHWGTWMERNWKSSLGKHGPLINELQGFGSALKGHFNRSVYRVCVYIHAHAICVYGTCISWIGFERWNVEFYKKHWFFPHELPGGFCNRVVLRFVLNLICGVSVLDMLRGVSIVGFHIDCACLDHSLS